MELVDYLPECFPTGPAEEKAYSLLVIGVISRLTPPKRFTMTYVLLVQP